MNRIRGVNPPAITIFDADGEIDYEAMERHADYMIENGVDGIAYLGTSGEFGVLTQKQKLELIRRMTAYVDHRAHVLIGVGDTCMTNTLELAAAAKAAGADGILAVPPYFSIYAEENVEAYYDELAVQCGLPVIIYNFPALTGFDMNPELVKRLAVRHENIVGIKDTIDDADHLRAMLRIKEVKPEFSVFCAYESQALDMVEAGIDGFVNATGNFAPGFTVRLCRAAQNHDRSQMETYSQGMCEASQVYNYAVPLFLAVKEAVYQCVLGKNGTEKLPGLPLGEEKRTEIKKLLKKLSLI